MRASLLTTLGFLLVHPPLQGQAVTGPTATISPTEAVVLIPATSIPDSARLFLVLSWNERSVARARLGTFGLWIQDTLPPGEWSIGERLRHLARSYFWLEPAGSIDAIVAPPEPALAVTYTGTAFRVTLGASTPLNELLAWRPDSLRLDRGPDTWAVTPGTTWVPAKYQP